MLGSGGGSALLDSFFEVALPSNLIYGERFMANGTFASILDPFQERIVLEKSSTVDCRSRLSNRLLCYWAEILGAFKYRPKIILWLLFLFLFWLLSNSLNAFLATFLPLFYCIIHFFASNGSRDDSCHCHDHSNNHRNLCHIY